MAKKKPLTQEQIERVTTRVKEEIEKQKEAAQRYRREWDARCAQGIEHRADAMDGERPCEELSRLMRSVDMEIEALHVRADEIKSGRFKGMCEECGKPIGFPRLNSHPAARVHVGCGKKHDVVFVRGRNGTTVVPRLAYPR